MAEQHRLIYPVKHFRDFLENNIRLDGRNFDKYRPIGVNINCFSNSLGSGAAKIGNSNVVCGIRADISKPRTHSPRMGYIIPNVEISFCSPTRTSSHDFPEILEGLIYNVINDSECINLKALCIQPGKYVWALYIDIICLEVDGGIFDTAVLACASALNNLKLPDVTYNETSDRPIVGTTSKAVAVNTLPLISTYCIFDRIVLMDPTYHEESLSNSIIHLGINKKSVALFHKNGGLPISRNEISTATQNAIAREAEIENVLKTLQS